MEYTTKCSKCNELNKLTGKYAAYGPPKYCMNCGAALTSQSHKGLIMPSMK